MRVLFWQELFWPYMGGLEILAANLLRSLRKRGHEIIMVTSHADSDLPDEERYQGIQIYRFPFRAALAEGDIGKLVQGRRQLTSLKREFSPDLVHINSVGPSMLFHLDTLNAHQAPVLATIHTLHQTEPKQASSSDLLLERMLRSADWITCVSNAVLTHTLQLFPEIISHACVIYNGMDMPPLSPEPLPTNLPQLLCVGRLIRDKGFDLALKGFASVVNRFQRARLVIAGDGPMRAALKKQMTELDLSDLVDFVGWVAPEKIPEKLNAATMVLMPSRREGLPLAAIEAAFMARPVVATRVGGLPEVVVHQETGLLVEQEDSSGLGDAISYLLEHPKAATKMGHTARKRAQKVFGWDRYVDAYDALYHKLGKGNCRY